MSDTHQLEEGMQSDLFMQEIKPIIDAIFRCVSKIKRSDLLAIRLAVNAKLACLEAEDRLLGGLPPTLIKCCAANTSLLDVAVGDAAVADLQQKIAANPGEYMEW